MTRAMSAQVSWARGPGKVRTVNGGNWDGGCLAFRFVAAGYPGTYYSAYAAYLVARSIAPLNPNPRTAMIGEEHYYSGVTEGRGVELGHIAGEEDGSNTLLMASAAVSINFGHNSGLVSYSDYQKRRGLHYLGHAPRMGRWPSATTDAAGINRRPLTNPFQEDDDMKVLANQTTNMWALGGSGRFSGIPAGQGALYLSLCGQDAPVALSDADFSAARTVYLGGIETDVRVYADTATNVWYLVGPGVFYPIPAGKGGLYESLYGTRIPVDTATINELHTALGSQGEAAVDVAGISAALSALNVPTAAENAQATVDALGKKLS